MPMEEVGMVPIGMRNIDGQIYACLAETITAGFLQIKESISIGSLTKKNVLKALEYADKSGLKLGQFKQIKAF